MGEELEKQQIQMRMEEEQLASSQESLFNIKRLKEVMSTQRAIFSARGQMAGVGTAGAITAQSENAFNADERARNLSLSFRQNQLKSQMSLYGIKREARASQRTMGYLQQGFNMFSFNSLGENPFGGSQGSGQGRGQSIGQSGRAWRNPNSMRSYG
jgi:hypothetical protein